MGRKAPPTIGGAGAVLPGGLNSGILDDARVRTAFRAGLVLVAVAAGLTSASGASSAGGWRQVRVDRQLGLIEATLSYQEKDPPGAFPERMFRAVKLVVRRNGIVRAERAISGGDLGDGGLLLRLQNVWGGPDPEVLVRRATCGNRCGVQLYVAITRPGIGRVLFHDFDGGIAGTDAWWGQLHDGRFEFVAYDQRFFCFFSSCATSSVPPQVLSIDASGTSFINVTRTRPDLVAANAARNWSFWLRERSKRSALKNEMLGLLAPWCADQYLLGRGKRCDRVLQQAIANGYLSRRGWFGSRHPVSLVGFFHRQLVRWGYAR